MDAATGLGGSAESLTALSLRWWHQAGESGQVWARWWLNGWLPAGWPSHGAAFSTSPPWLPRRADVPMPGASEEPDGAETAPGAPAQVQGQAAPESASPVFRTSDAAPPLDPPMAARAAVAERRAATNAAMPPQKSATSAAKRPTKS